ncbi:MAG TPA: M12 family metallo-peptidase, partial [Vicinamibacterales bacterium]|nr:M12 family metallo-peptidase [Vicinamibacterales bacterium]
MTHSNRPQPPSSLLLRALFVGGLFLTVLGIGSQAAPPAGKGHGHGHGRTLMAEPPDGQSDLLPLGDLPRTTRRARRAIADATSLQGDAATGDDVVDLNLFDDVHLRAKRKGLDVTRRNGYVWKGALLDLPGEASIAVQDGVMTGTVFANDTVYEIRYRGNGEHEVREIIPSEFPSDDDPSADIAIDVPDVAGTGASGGAQVAGDTGSQIDVMIVYTNAARASVGGTAAMQSLIDLAIANANTAYANSGVIQRVRLVHTAEVTYTEAGSNTDLTRLQNPTDGYLDNVPTLRNTYGADVVSLLGNGYGCGLGYMMSTPSTGFASYAYSVVDQTCAAGNLSLAHEMGHNMGLNHDPANASGTPSYTYAYGFQQPSGLFRTVMAYPCPSGSCPRLMYFSNPNVLYNSHATGTSTQNNALALNNTANTVAIFRQSVSGSCTYSLTPTSSSVGAGGATSSFTMTSQTGCAWSASSSQSWLSITSGASGSGTGTVGYSVAANTAGTSRSATITAGGKTFTVTQAAAACSYSISSTSQSAGSGGGSYSVSVTGTTGCAWTAVSNSSWITVSAGASGSGNGSVSLSVAANTSTGSRTG